MHLKADQEDVSNLQNTQRGGEERRMENNKQKQKSRHGHSLPSKKKKKPALEREARDGYRVCASQATALRFCRLNA